MQYLLCGFHKRELRLIIIAVCSWELHGIESSFGPNSLKDLSYQFREWKLTHMYYSKEASYSTYNWNTCCFSLFRAGKSSICQVHKAWMIHRMKLYNCICDCHFLWFTSFFSTQFNTCQDHSAYVTQRLKAPSSICNWHDWEPRKLLLFL